MARNIAAAGPPPDRDGGSVRVLIVDDSAVTRAVMERIVTASGRYVVVASVSTIAAGLAALERLRVDLILLDMLMPGLMRQILAASV